MDDLISRQVAQHKINALIDEFETIMKDIRERHVDDSVCGLCEYDGAFMSDSGSWCNECPGFERDDCFKLKDQYREEWAGAIKNLPPVQPNHNAEPGKMVDDCISRQAAMDAIAKMMPRSYTPDGSHPADEEIFRAQEIFADCIETIEILPSAQPTITHEQAIDYLQETGWLQNHDRILTESKIVPPVQPKNGTLIIPLNESDFKSVKRIILDNKPWCRTFYEDVPGEAHWIKSYTPDDGEIYECDNCGVTWQFNDGGPEENEAFYCPKCGFKMVPKEGEADVDRI